MITLQDFLSYFESRVEQLLEDRRFHTYLTIAALSLFTTGFIGLVSGSGLWWLWSTAMILGVIGSIIFYLNAYFSVWMAFQFDRLRLEILVGKLRSRNTILARWMDLSKKAETRAPWMSKWSRLGAETFDVDLPPESEQESETELDKGDS